MLLHSVHRVGFYHFFIRWIYSSYCSELTGQKPVKIYHCAVLPCRTMCFRQEPSQHKMELLPCKDQRYNRPRCFLLDTLSWHLISEEKSTLKVRFPHCKVEKILKVSLDSIPSPSPLVKIQILGGKVCLRCNGKTLLGGVNKLFVFKSLLTSLSSFCLITSSKVSRQ